MYPSPASANDKLTAGILSLIFSIALVIPIFFLELSLPPREDVQVVPLELLPPPPPPELPKSQEPVKAKPKLREKPVAKTPKRPPAFSSQRPMEKESPSDLAKETTPSPPLEAQPKQGDVSQKHLSAEAPASPPPPPPPSPPPAQKPAEDLLARYYSKLQAAIDARKQYPEAAKRYGITGKVVLTVRIESDGRISSVLISGSSASRILDSEAQRLIRSIGKFDPPPGGQAITVSVAITYSLED